MKKGRLAWIAAVILGTVPLGAEPASTEIVLARRLFGEARAAEEARDWVAAASKLQEAIAIKETAGLRFHLAYCQEQQGLLVEALVDYERSEDLATGGNEEFRAQLPAKRESLHRRIPTVTLLVPPQPKNVTLTIDGRQLPSSLLGKPMPLNPGRHKLVLSAPDHLAFTTELSLNETDAVVANAVMRPLPKRQQVSLLPPAAPAPLTPPPSLDVENTGIRARTYVLIGEGALAAGALAVGIGYSMRAAKEDDRADRALDEVTRLYPMGNGCYNHPENALLCADLHGAVDARGQDRLVARIGFIGAGLAAAGFVGTLILWRGPAKAAIVPSIGVDTAKLSVSGHF